MNRQWWDERYAEPGLAYGSEPNDFLAAVADRLPTGRNTPTPQPTVPLLHPSL